MVQTYSPRMTADELIRLPRGTARYELWRGELRTMPLHGAIHSLLSVRVSTTIHQFVRRHELGLVVGGGCGFHVEHDPDTVLAPDAAFIRQARIPESGLPEGFWPGAPDLAVEVVAPDDATSAVDDRSRFWLTAGAECVWIVNPRTRTIDIDVRNSARRTLAEDEVLSGGALLPGFESRVADLFWEAR